MHPRRTPTLHYSFTTSAIPSHLLLAWHILTSEVDEANQRLRDALTFERTHER
jgi:hypothetical protein